MNCLNAPRRFCRGAAFFDRRMHPRNPFGLLPPTVAWAMWAQLQRLVGPIVLLATVIRLHGAAAEQMKAARVRRSAGPYELPTHSRSRTRVGA